jgi:HD-like signal output (HDOD) protein
MLDASRRRVTPGGWQGPSPLLPGQTTSVRSVLLRGLSRGSEALDTLVEEIADVRPLPPIAAQVLQIAEGENFSAHELAQAISSDPALTARVLKVANSAYYGFPRRITTVRDAVVLLGFRQIRSVALAACAMRALPSDENIDSHRFWEHAVTIGMLAERLARHEGRHQDTAFTAGVLHNIGRLALDQVRPGLFALVCQRAARSGQSIHDVEREMLGFTDAELGGALALRWRFPADLALAIARHAEPLEGLCDPSGLAAMVVRARAEAATLGLDDGAEPDHVICRRRAEARARWVGPTIPTVHRAVVTVMSPADLPAPRGIAADSTPDPLLRALVDEDGGVEALLARADAFVEHATT